MINARPKLKHTQLHILNLLKNNNIRGEILKFFYKEDEHKETSKIAKDLIALKISTKQIYGNVDIARRKKLAKSCFLSTEICVMAGEKCAAKLNPSVPEHKENFNCLCCLVCLPCEAFGIVLTTVATCFGYVIGSIEDGIHYCKESNNEGIILQQKSRM